jgi:glutamine---fructose-6-phosphate transaminase (isomerizing)
MCGIVGATAKRSVAKLLIDSLKRLEYRGYDSAGLAVIDDQQQLQRLRVAGKVQELEKALNAHPLTACLGIAHTRWATHGAPVEKNAHPFTSGDEIALVHNGIIENHLELREKLLGRGYQFHSETDTETAVHLIHYYFTQTNDLLSAVSLAAKELKGAYSLGICSIHFPHQLIGVRQGAPLVIGLGQEEQYLASDPLALIALTQQFIYLEDEDIALLDVDQVRIFKDGEQVERKIHTLALGQDVMERGKYRHFMKKEVMEQPDAIACCLEGRMSKDHLLPGIFGPQTSVLFPKVEHVHLVACGTSYHAALVARYWIEHLAQLPCTVEVASEFRYRNIAISKNSLFVTLSQSGETADTLAALRLAKKMAYLSTLVICNVPSSTMTREADLQFLTHAGVEIGVASTKAFITQLISLFLLALSLKHEHQKNTADECTLVTHLEELPRLVETVLQQDHTIANWAQSFTHKEHALFLGRGCLYPIALEGALKMKEISYIHAEGYPAGELKHGPLALVDHDMPVIAMLPHNQLFEKTLSNLQEVRARGGKLFVFSDACEQLRQDAAFADVHCLNMPKISNLLSPILYTIPLQLLAYHVAVLKGTDVDQPRNLAKSVTVE